MTGEYLKNDHRQESNLRHRQVLLSALTTRLPQLAAMPEAQKVIQLPQRASPRHTGGAESASKVGSLKFLHKSRRFHFTLKNESEKAVSIRNSLSLPPSNSAPLPQKSFSRFPMLPTFHAPSFAAFVGGVRHEAPRSSLRSLRGASRRRAFPTNSN